MVAGESSYQSSCESDGDGQSSVASPSYKVHSLCLKLHNYYIRLADFLLCLSNALLTF